MKMAVSERVTTKGFLWAFLNRLNSALFEAQIKLGLVIPVVEFGEGLPSENNPVEIAESIGDETQENKPENATEETEVVVSIGGESPASEEVQTPAPVWVKDLRKNQRELQKRNRELEEQLKAVQSTAQKPQELGQKPTLENCDYDSAKYETDLEQWYLRKREQEAIEAAKRTETEAANKAWQDTLSGYTKAKSELKVRDFDECEETVKDSLSVTQQGVILQGAKNPALLVYAIGKNPQKAKELGLIKDPVKFAFAIANLEAQLKVTSRKSAPQPERTVKGSGGTSGAVDNQLDRLRADAEKTGNYSKVIAYKNQLRNNA